MKIALPISDKSADAEIYDSFGRAPFYLIYSTSTKETEFLDHRAVVSQGGAGVRAAQVLADNGVRVIISPQCGENAEKILRNSEVLIYQSVSGSIQENIEAYQQNQLHLLSEFKPNKGRGE